MSGAKSRRKGATFERQLARMFREELRCEDIKRGFQYRDGSEAPDVDMPVLWVEAKAHQRCNIKAALRQAQAALTDAKSSKVALAVCKDDGQEPIAAMYLSDFIDLFSSWWKLTNQ